MPESTTRESVLAAQLAAFEPFDTQEGRHRDALLALLEHGPQAFHRDHYAPGHVTASAFVLSPDASQVLLILHGKLGLWLQPGGHVDPLDASVEAAARREAREETGLDALQLEHAGLFDVDVHTIPARGAQPEHRHYDVRFLFRSPTLEVRAGSDARSARWVPVGEVADAGTDRSVLRAIDKIRGRGR